MVRLRCWRGVGPAGFRPVGCAATAAPLNPIQAENALAGTTAWQARGRRYRAVCVADLRGRRRRAGLPRQHREPLPDRRVPARLVRRRRRAARRMLAGLQRRRAGPDAGAAGRGQADPRRLAGDRHDARRRRLDERLLPRRGRAHERAVGREGRDHVLRRPSAGADARLERARAGAGQHLGGVQRLGRQEPVRLLPASRLRRLVRPAVRDDGAVADVVGDPARALPRARGLRRLLPDRRRHRPRRREPAPASARHGRRPRRVLERRDARRVRHGAADGTNLAFMGSNDGYWQVKYADGDRTIVSAKSLSDPTRSSHRRRRCSARSAGPSAN